MTDHQDPLDALRAELANVSVSPRFAECVRSRVKDHAFATLSDELAGVKVSPVFAARVRQGIERAPAGRRWMPVLDWRWAVPAVAAAAIVAVSMIATRPAVTLPRQVTYGMPIEAPAAQAAPLAVAPVAPAQVATPAARRPPARPAVVVAPPEAEPALEVITNQPALLRQMWAQARAASALGDPTESAPLEVREISIEPVEVTPVAVKWLVEPLPAPGALPIIRRVSARAAERSLQ